MTDRNVETWNVAGIVKFEKAPVRATYLKSERILSDFPLFMNLDARTRRRPLETKSIKSEFSLHFEW